ncbi:class I SAM-dependent methyltransferase [Pseudomonas sp. CGJS7]|uniref:class I SAM-dependent methyltransferase n=1 Tax=Pseudomonas sp. CGJS7 TaxID=3109348 RepID=UPI00300B7828
MAQITGGIRRLLSSPIVYDAFQALLGGDAARREIADTYFKARPGHVVVDVGCGTAEILNFLPQGIRYYGFDLEQAYIDSAQAQFAGRGEFYCQDVTLLEAGRIPPCELAISFGVLHHLDDDGASRLIDNLYGRLAEGGRLVTIDPAFEPGQSVFAREMIRRDRGQNVRSGEGYSALVSSPFRDKRLTVRHDLLRIPYTHAIMECTK